MHNTTTTAFLALCACSTALINITDPHTGAVLDPTQETAVLWTSGPEDIPVIDLWLLSEDNSTILPSLPTSALRLVNTTSQPILSIPMTTPIIISRPFLLVLSKHMSEQAEYSLSVRTELTLHRRHQAPRWLLTRI